MTPHVRLLLLGWLLVQATQLAAAPDDAAVEYPRKTILLVCPWSPGGGTDRVSRFFADALSRELGQPVVVVNKTGGSGAIGHTAGAYAKPDGYTLAMITFELSTMHRMGITDLTFEDFTCVMQVNGDAAAILVANDAPWQNLGEFLDQAAANPGQLKISGTATGGAWDLARAGLQLAADVPVDSIAWVPTKGAAPSLKELLGGHIDAVCCSVPEAASQIEAGQLRVLAIMAEQRHPDFPDVPTALESGVPWVALGWRGLAMPKGTPPAIVNIIEEKCLKIARSDEYKRFMDQNGFGIIIRPRDEFRQFLKQQDDQWAGVVEAAGYDSMENHDPGPLFFPGILAGLLGCCGIICWVGGRRDRTAVYQGHSASADRTPEQLELAGEAPADSTSTQLDWSRILLLILGVSVYVVSLGWLGFSLSTLAFSITMMRGLHSRWSSAIVISLILVVGVRLLFVVAFRVQLPTGELGLPF